MTLSVLVDHLFGPPDDASDRSVAVLHAHAAALAWVRDATGGYPVLPSILIDTPTSRSTSWRSDAATSGGGQMATA
jgi:hypothetical protein